jgi:hypothetical protein
MVQNTEEIKDRIVSILKTKGPSLPVHIGREIKSSILFSSAFLSELISEKRIKISNMRVGNSPLYFLPGQEYQLERFSNFLKSKEKEAFLLLKEKKFLKDSTQAPAIRVALREIRDFAVPFKFENEIFWRYFLIPEEEFRKYPKEEKKEVIKIKEAIEKKEIEEKPLDIFGEEHPEKREKPKIKKKAKRTVKKKTKENKFFSKVKEFLSKKSIEIIDIENFGKKDIILRVREQNKEKLLVAYNKNKLTENDILKASKKASESKLPYIVLGNSGPLKKLENLIEAMKNLSSIEGIK